MNYYVPPFTITNEILDKVSSIMKKIGKLDHYDNLNKMPNLRRNNRIKSIHSSLAIESNSLSFNQVRDVIDGKMVIGSQKEIQEVKNAYDAYLKINDVNPYKLNDLKMIHGIMTKLIIDDAGFFRKGDEGVFDAKGNCVHICPPPGQINDLMINLFEWMKQKKNEIHPLILSSVLHYEFVFIHPFSDGNGRMARFWQNVILTKWEPIFEYIPIESEIKEFQDEYYIVINNCNAKGDSTLFILFMLDMIDKVLNKLIDNVNDEENNVNFYVKSLLDVMDVGIRYKTSELMNLLGLKSRVSFRNNYLKPALDNGLILMTYPDNPTNKNQTYYK